MIKYKFREKDCGDPVFIELACNSIMQARWALEATVKHPEDFEQVPAWKK